MYCSPHSTVAVNAAVDILSQSGALSQSRNPHCDITTIQATATTGVMCGVHILWDLTIM